VWKRYVKEWKSRERFPSDGKINVQVCGRVVLSDGREMFRSGRTDSTDCINLETNE